MIPNAGRDAAKKLAINIVLGEVGLEKEYDNFFENYIYGITIYPSNYILSISLEKLQLIFTQKSIHQCSEQLCIAVVSVKRNKLKCPLIHK